MTVSIVSISTLVYVTARRSSSCWASKARICLSSVISAMLARFILSLLLRPAGANAPDPSEPNIRRVATPEPRGFTAEAGAVPLRTGLALRFASFGVALRAGLTAGGQP